ncbi:FadR/GntR family transcriptional regulator [Nitrospirillum viridazoti]|uniref:Transcriptional regulator n=1 Tax=Nitrospirillum viridazoti CBAmc TaxID=1441467 RepID=A0A248JVG1_9PROT|nr:FCD domain-containing protein [Nitrospirillum amazonense]ASG22516.1 transcriptional regulator [Nitrospirillum amazonense CBAmc]TWB42927.1 GntR family transcriptional regulator [Nitrospirillum amazonense]
MAFARLAILPTYKVVSDTIEREILAGRLNAGDILPTETELADQFGVTRHTVREGIRILEQSGLVRREAGRRLYVAEPHYGDLAPRLSRAMVMQRVTFRELWEVSMDLEPSAAAHAAGRIDASRLAQLRANVEATEEAIAAGTSIIPLDVAFHILVAEAAGNRALLLAREPVTQLFYPALERLFRHPKTSAVGPRRLVEAHRHIVEALADGDAAVAREWMRKHMVDFRRGYDTAGLDLDEALDPTAAPPAAPPPRR